MKTIRISTLLGLSLASAFASAQMAAEPDLQTKVSIESVAMPIKRALAALSEKTKIQLDTSAAIDNEIVILALHDAPLGQVMDHIATATGGKWEREENLIRLTRSALATNADANAELNTKVTALREAIARDVESLKPKKPDPKAKPKPGEPPVSVTMRGGQGPITKAIIRLLQFLDVRSLAQLDSDGRLVYATTPTRMQVQMPGNFNSIMSELVAEHNRQIAAQPQTEPDDDGDADYVEMRKFMEELGFMPPDQKVVNERPAKALLVAQRNGFMGGIQLQLKLYSSKGTVLLQGDHYLNDGGASEMLAMGGVAVTEGSPLGGGDDEEVTPALPRNPKPKPVDMTNDKNIEWSPMTKEIVAAFGSGMEGMRGAPKLSDNLRKVLMRPDIYDPLSFQPSETLIAISRHKKVNIVAVLPDSFNSVFSFMTPTAGTVNTAVENLKSNKSIKLDEKAGYWMIRPTSPVATRQQRIHRGSLATLIAAADAKGQPSLGDTAAYAALNPPPMESPSAMLYLAVFAQSVFGGGMMGLTEWNMLRFYNTMNPMQQKSMVDGLTISFGTLSPAQRALTQKVLFGAQAKIDTGPPKEDTVPFLDMMTMFMPQRGGDWRTEPTEVMPNGIPAAGNLVITGAAEPVAVPEKGTDEASMITEMMGALGPSELAFFKLMKEMPNNGMMGMEFEFDRVRLGNRNNYKFSFHVAEGATVRKALSETVFDKNGKVVSMNDLNSDFKARIEKAYAAIKNSSFFKMMSGGMGAPAQAQPPQK